jgi:hypothetical protein
VSRFRAVPLGIGVLAALATLGLAGRASGASAVPTPDQVLGFRPGTDYKLADYEQLVRYFRALDAASERVRVVDIGKSTEGRVMIAALITSEANHRRLDRIREISRLLARARPRDDAEARALAAEGRAVVWIDSGLHATEVATAQHAPELAYRVATDESEEMRRIRDEVVLLQVPLMNPDGLERVVGWYRRNLGTPYEVAPMVELYHRYVGHDNNRDWYMFQMPESRNVARLLYEEWFPQIVYNHHQTAPFPARIFVPPFTDPMNPNIPPQVMRGIHTVGDAITQRLEREGKVGAISRVAFDTWWNGGMRTAPYFHNMVGILTETALWRYATPHQYDETKLPKRFRDGTPADAPTTFYPSPWKGGWWRLRDAVDYMLTASLATLDVAARKRTDWLFGIYQMGRDAIRAGGREKPHAYVIAADQRDPGAAARLLDALRTGGVELQRARAAFQAGGRRFEAGSVVVPLAQPFRAYAKDLLEVQRYPDRRAGPSGQPQTPYDITGWTLPAQMGVEGAWVDEAFSAPVDPLTAGSDAFAGSLSGTGALLVVDGRANGAFVLANRALAGGGDVRRATAAFSAAGRNFEPGTFLVRGLERLTAESLARAHGVRVFAMDQAPAVATVAVAKPRLGLYKPWVANMDEGWTRWLLEQHEFPHRTLTDADVRRGRLRGELDVIVLPDAGVRSLLDGHLRGSVPPEFTGGLGLAGASALEEFVREGGTLVALDSASDLPLDLFGLAVRNALKGVPRSDYYSPGGLLRVVFDPKEPLAWGLPADGVAFVENGPAFEEETLDDEEGEETPALAPTDHPKPRFAARFAEKDVLYSGWLLGEAKIAGKGAVVDAPHGHGRVVLIGFRSQFRAQPYGTFKVLFNALLPTRPEGGETDSRN